MAKVKCPNCNQPVEWGPDAPFRPFCSRRCRLLDLGAWLDGSNHIPGAELAGEELTQLDGRGRPANDELDQ